MLPKNFNYAFAFVLCFVYTAATIGCKKNGTNELSSSEKIYVTGYTVSQTGDYNAIYWKNGSVVNLPNIGQGTSGYPQANSIYVNGSDVYVVGFNRFTGLFWKNQVLQQILNAVNLVPKSIFISANDIYVAGDSVHDYPSNTNSYGTYWKNNIPNYLPTCNTATSIIVSGNDAYVTGSGGGKAAYWKNGSPVYLTGLGANTGYAYGIAVAGSDVYVTGDTSTSYNGVQSVYWKNGVAINLENGIHASGIAVSDNGDLYVSGQSMVNFNSRATYWKNGKVIVLSEAKSHANSITVLGQDVYVAGDTSVQSGISTAVYWKNGVVMPLTQQGIGSSSATSIFISK